MKNNFSELQEKLNQTNKTLNALHNRYKVLYFDYYRNPTVPSIDNEDKKKYDLMIRDCCEVILSLFKKYLDSSLLTLIGLDGEFSYNHTIDKASTTLSFNLDGNVFNYDFNKPIKEQIFNIIKDKYKNFETEFEAFEKQLGQLIIQKNIYKKYLSELASDTE